MASAFWASRQRNKLLLLAAALVAVVGATAYAQIRLNAWNRPFYDALTRKDMPTFVGQLGVFAEVAGILLVLNVAQTWLNQMSKVVLREGLVHDLMNEWLAPLRAFRLSNSGGMGANPDQRLAGGRPASHRSHDRPRHRPAAIDAAPAVVHRRALGAVARHVSAVRAATSSPCPAIWCGARSSMPEPHRSSVGASAAR